MTEATIQDRKQEHAVGRMTSANGILSLLDESIPELVLFGLERLDAIVDEFWSEVADHVCKLEILYENEQFEHRTKAALVVSKVYYHLGSYDDSLAFALAAAKLFTATQPSEYYETITSRALDQYIKQCQMNAEIQQQQVGKSNSAVEWQDKIMIDPRLEGMVDNMFDCCLMEGQYKQLIGIALECHRLDVFEEAIVKSKNINDSLSYAYDITMKLFNNHCYRTQIVAIITKLYKNLVKQDLLKLTQCYIYLEDDAAIHKLLLNLLNSQDYLLAYQIGFDLYESSTQQFLARILNRLISSAPLPELVNCPKELPLPERVQPPAPPSSPKNSKVQATESQKVEKPREELSKQNCKIEKEQAKLRTLTLEERVRQERFTKLASIIAGDVSISLNLQFLIRSNKSDSAILKTTKDFVKNSICQNATVIANGFLHCGTTSDEFLRNSLDWLGKAVNWAKFNATASLGVIHKHHERDALRLMHSYLPKESGASAGYTEGGALYALGLIHAGHGARVLSYLQQQLVTATSEPVKHGTCLALGLAALGTHNRQVYDQLRAVLYEDDAVIGEAASIAMGLVMLGSGDYSVIKEMMLYARESQHEKIQRGASIGVALVVFNRLEGADCLIDNLLNDVDPLMRRAGVQSIAMAYCGTGCNNAIRQLLYVAVSDVHNDVRRAAVQAIGFVMFRQPEQCPGLVSPLLESFNPHVRYGAALALGIACCGTGSIAALELLVPLIKDSTPFVRQAALIASALIAVQHNALTCSKSKEFRDIYQRVISDKMETVMVKFGAILAQGIIDAGGRNCTITLESAAGHTSSASVVGMFVFTQFWFWFPLAHFLSLSFRPTSLIALNADLKMPKLFFKSNVRPSLFAYAAMKEGRKKKKDEQVATSAVLSSTWNVKKENASKKTEEQRSSKTSKSSLKGSKKSTKSLKTIALEPTFELKDNPARVLRKQLKYIQMVEGSTRYEPVKSISSGGIIVMSDRKPNDPTEFVIAVKSDSNCQVEEEREPGPPEPFDPNS